MRAKAIPQLVDDLVASDILPATGVKLGGSLVDWGRSLQPKHANQLAVWHLKDVLLLLQPGPSSIGMTYLCGMPAAPSPVPCGICRYHWQQGQWSSAAQHSMAQHGTAQAAQAAQHSKAQQSVRVVGGQLRQHTRNMPDGTAANSVCMPLLLKQQTDNKKQHGSVARASEVITARHCHNTFCSHLH